MPSILLKDLCNCETLDMIEIPSGTFMMGSPKSEEGRNSDERPQHEVTVPSFYMAKSQITQAQWKAVTTMPKIERELDPDPSHFKGDDLPVEQVSWFDAVEFCKRLSKATGREYRLPSEAEWEYACRAGTTTPFHFGETITTDLSNYNGRYTYADAQRGEFRQTTVPVTTFLLNAFGLYDMHGNAREWCADTYKNSYEGAPSDGSAWINDDNTIDKVTRGGSWLSFPSYCRSAARYSDTPNLGNDETSLRVVCTAPRST